MQDLLAPRGLATQNVGATEPKTLTAGDSSNKQAAGPIHDQWCNLLDESVLWAAYGREGRGGSSSPLPSGTSQWVPCAFTLRSGVAFARGRRGTGALHVHDRQGHDASQAMGWRGPSRAKVWATSSGKMMDASAHTCAHKAAYASKQTAHTMHRALQQQPQPQHASTRQPLG
jgi:hypothetical protein